MSTEPNTIEAQASVPTEPQIDPVAATQVRAGGHGFARNLSASTRALALLRTTESDWQISWGQLIALLAMGVLLPLAVDFIRIGPGGELNLYALPGLLFSVPLLLLSAWAIAAHGARSHRTLELLVAFSGMLFVADLAYLATYYVIVDLLAVR